ncbi:hypothetical protein CAEBREN_00479 [Caenorhabditis brenneri]|uniref:Sdz-33 F-box domain-containing protein n=1 Tax=Caenorhabditis brenneri TaxID=135651 RepID=G0N0G4_CAEBE|nr:hypothetical protein CAEBREN_00479 [Caenorhabditis brenneri]
MAAAPTHPLLSLPDDEIIRKLRKMSIDKILNFSMISERCKDLVKSIQIKGTSISVFIDSEITFSITTDLNELVLHYYTQSENTYWRMGAYGRKKKLLTPRTIMVRLFDNDEKLISGPTLTCSELALKDWLKHLQDIFNYNGIDSIQFSGGSTDFDIDDIREVFGNKSKLDLLPLRSDAYGQLILEKFSPIGKLSIIMSSFPNSEIPPSFLNQNFEYLCIEGLFHEEMMTLDELLMINSKRIKIDEVQVSPEDFNKFIKLWQQGSNSRMEYLSIHCLDDEEDDPNNEECNANTIMKGIKHEMIPDNRIRKFKSVESKNPRLVHGGMDIYRNDGVKATIQIERSLFTTVWHMYVWFDHCVVES